VQINLVSLLLINFRKFTDDKKDFVRRIMLKEENHGLTIGSKPNSRKKKFWCAKVKTSI